MFTEKDNRSNKAFHSDPESHASFVALRIMPQKKRDFPVW